MKRLPPANSNRKDKNPNNLFRDRNLHIIVAITLIAILGIITINPTLPTLAQAFNVSADQIGLVIAVFVIPMTIGVPIFGVLADRVGRKKVLVPSLLLFAVAGVLCATAQDFRSLLEWRFLQGIGATSLESLALTLIGDLYVGKALIPAMAFNASMIGVGTTLYPLLGGALAAVNWRFVFLLSLFAVPLALFVVTSLKLPVQRVEQEAFSLKGYLKDTWVSIKNRQVLGLLLTVICVFIMQFGPCFVYVPMLAGTKLHARSEMIGVLLAAMQVSMAFFAAQLGFLSRRFSELTLIKIAFLLFATGLLMASFVTNIEMLFVPAVLLGAGEAFSLPPTRALLAKLSPDDARAGFMAVNTMAQSIGQALGPVLAGVAFAVWGMNGVFYACAGFAFFTIILIHLFLAPRYVAKPIRTEEFY